MNHQPKTFVFNSQTIQQFIPPEQRKLYLQPFDQDLACYSRMMEKYYFPASYRLVSKSLVRELSIVVIEDLPECLRRFPAMIINGDDRAWGFGFRYRADVPWYVAAFGNGYAMSTLHSYPVIKLLHTKDLISWLPLERFVIEGLWCLQQDKQPDWNPLSNFLFGLNNYLRPELLCDLTLALKGTDFFSVPAGAGLQEPLDFDLVADKSLEAWDEVGKIAENFYCPYHNVELQDFWRKVRENPKTQLWLAKSKLHPEPTRTGPMLSSGEFAEQILPPTTLGFLLGGLHPLNEEPTLYALAILPDERRRGIGTSLIRRFFSQTNYENCTAVTYFGPYEYHYEGAALLKKLGATVKTKGRFVWHWNLPSLYRVVKQNLD